MSLRVYNTLNKKKEDFTPIRTGKVSMYVCGPTVYDSCHIGHARSVVVFDVIARYLRSQKYDLTYVRNFTDVDDKIINRANEINVDPKEVAEKYIKEFNEDMDSLNVLRPDMEPKATEHIDHIIRVIEILMEKGLAYQVDGDVYYLVEKFKDYGKLSGRRLDEMEAGARVDVDERKSNPFDFALWKSAKPGEPFWESPWGKGRPGWHIECSAMSKEHLGESFDIHGGGKDLIFPHHENEIAQSEGAFGQRYVKYWIHNGFVNIDHEKMSKSLGNFTIIRDVLKLYHPEALRLFLLSNHYRSPVDFTDKSMDEASSGLDKIYAFLKRLDDRMGGKKDDQQGLSDLWKRFCEAMDDDFNTAQGIGIVFDAVRSTNRLLDEKKDGNDDDLNTALCSLRSDMLKIGNILGILTKNPHGYFDSKKTSAIESCSIDATMIELKIQERKDARKAKDFEKADKIRKELEDMNIILEDGPEGTTWKVKAL
jgi:cysteinyl-tRNA synthetase